jgi:hypothetical protein
MLDNIVKNKVKVDAKIKMYYQIPKGDYFLSFWICFVEKTGLF